MPVALLRSQIPQLARRFQNAYAKRVEENKIKFGMPPKAAEDEALLEVGRLVYLARCKEDAVKAQQPLFGDGKLPRARR